MTEDEMVGWHHWLNGHEFEQAPRVGDGQGRLECCSPWGHKVSDTTERMNWIELTSSWIMNISKILPGKMPLHKEFNSVNSFFFSAKKFHVRYLIF